MPVLTVNTNVPSDKVPANFAALATDVIAKSLGKPTSYIAVQVNAGQSLYFGGSDKPAAVCDLVSIGSLSTDSNKKHSKALMELFETSLGVPASRTYITFMNTNKADIGFDKTTFDDLM